MHTNTDMSIAQAKADQRLDDVANAYKEQIHGWKRMVEDLSAQLSEVRESRDYWRKEYLAMDQAHAELQKERNEYLDAYIRATFS